MHSNFQAAAVRVILTHQKDSRLGETHAHICSLAGYISEHFLFKIRSIHLVLKNRITLTELLTVAEGLSTFENRAELFQKTFWKEGR